MVFEEWTTNGGGRIAVARLNSPRNLNSLSMDMICLLKPQLQRWADDDSVCAVWLEAEGDKAFCAGGDIAELYDTGTKGDFAYGRKCWADEYRMNAKLFEFPKPVVSFMQGFTMGGGVGVGCHGSHRVVGTTSQIAMPECGIGLVPDVGGSLILARAPGRLGEYLGLTGARMGPADVLHAGFADYFIDEAQWHELIATLEENGDPFILDKAATQPAPDPPAEAQAEIDHLFAGESLGKHLTLIHL